MNKRIRNRYKSNKNNVILNHIKNNIDIYIVVSILFLIGLVIGVVIINNLPDNKIEPIKEYISSSIESLKSGNTLLKKQILIQSLLKNAIIILVIWTLSLTFFGKYLLCFASCILGIAFGYTTSALMIPFNIGQSILLFLSAIFLQNVITIPTIIYLCVQYIKSNKEFDNRKDLKLIIFNNTVHAVLGMIMLFLSSLIEIYISDNLIIHITKYL